MKDFPFIRSKGPFERQRFFKTLLGEGFNVYLLPGGGITASHPVHTPTFHSSSKAA